MISWNCIFCLNCRYLDISISLIPLIIDLYLLIGELGDLLLPIEHDLRLQLVEDSHLLLILDEAIKLELVLLLALDLDLLELQLTLYVLIVAYFDLGTEERRLLNPIELRLRNGMEASLLMHVTTCMSIFDVIYIYLILLVVVVDCVGVFCVVVSEMNLDRGLVLLL
jgi:hypothetical protein